MIPAKNNSRNFEYFIDDIGSFNSRHEIYRLWYDVYFKEMKRNLKYADHANETLIDGLEPKSRIVIAKNQKEIVGTFRVSLPGDCNFGYYNELYQLDNFKSNEIAIGTRYMILPQYRGNHISKELMAFAITFLKNIGRKTLIIDCNLPVYNLFKKMNFVDYLEEENSVEFGKVKIMKYEIM